MTPVVVAALVVLAAADGAFSGFRSSVGRTGLVDHRGEDIRAQARGLVVVTVLLVPAAACALVDPDAAVDAAFAMLVVYAPYGVLVLIALAAYGTLHWRRRFLAMALLLGPLTLLRPAGALAGLLVADDALVGAAVVLSVAAALVVGPACDRYWYGRGRDVLSEDR